MLELLDVDKRYGPTVALDGMTFVARPGTVTGFLGPNGAGRSTALRVLLGLDRPAWPPATACRPAGCTRCSTCAGWARSPTGRRGSSAWE